MKIFMTGGTGFVGTTLIRILSEKGHEISLLTRPAENTGNLQIKASLVMGDPTLRGPWQERVAGHDVVINLAGASIFSRWTEAMKHRLRESRILTTRNIVEAMGPAKNKTQTLLSTSAVGYYGFHDEKTLQENDPAGTDFLAMLAADWEQEACEAKKFGARVVICRFGIVLGRQGGGLKQMLPIFKTGLGSPLGSGNQWFSWIHEDDLARIFLFLLERSEIEGPVNCTAPHPVRNRELTEALGKALRRPTFLPPVPVFAMRLVLGEFGDVLLKGQRVVPEKLLTAGFTFRYPGIDEALNALVS